MATDWPTCLPVVQLRIARPTAQLQAVVAFYRDGLALPVIFSYEDDAGYDGVMFGLPGRHYHLEITQRRGDVTCPAPPPDNLLVLYIPDTRAIAHRVECLGSLGHQPMTPRNPYWAAHGITFRDPDGWHVVLMQTPGFGDDIE